MILAQDSGLLDSVTWTAGSTRSPSTTPSQPMSPSSPATKHYSTEHRYSSIELPYCMSIPLPRCATSPIDLPTARRRRRMFVPAKANDLSSGELFAMKVKQTSTRGRRCRQLRRRVGLPSAKPQTRRSRPSATKSAGSYIRPTDMFEIAPRPPAPPSDYDFTCGVAGFKPTVTVDGGCDVLLLKTGTEIAASRSRDPASTPRYCWAPSLPVASSARASPGREDRARRCASPSLPTKPPMEDKLDGKATIKTVITSAFEQNKCGWSVIKAPRRRQPHQVHLSPHLLHPKDKSFNTEDKLGHTDGDDDCDIHNIANPTTSRS